MTKKPTPAKYRFQMFRSWARDITSEARESQKYGGSADTNGKLARAIEKGYKMGFEDAQKSDGPSSPDDLPAGRPVPTVARHLNSRVRSVIHLIGLWNNGREERFDPSLGPRAFYVQDEMHKDLFSDKPP